MNEPINRWYDVLVAHQIARGGMIVRQIIREFYIAKAREA